MPAGRQSVLSEGRRERDEVRDKNATRIDNRTMGKIPVENARDTDVAEEKNEERRRRRRKRRWEGKEENEK